ncbi:MAG TPA: hypothetical protein VFV66_19115, partial [Nonomuraea sp.]|nr:hypothetical protein [Nonomuraea sp.]
MTAVGFRCDAGPEIGVGHLVRCVALAEELRGRGVEVVFLGAVNGSEWARAQLGARGLPLVAAPADPAGLAALARRLGLGAVVLDSYELARETGAALRGAGLAVLAIVDGDPLGQDADLYLDQNLGADHRPPPAASARLGEAAASARPVGAKGSAGRPGGAKGSAGWPGGARVSARWLAGARYVLLRDSV